MSEETIDDGLFESGRPTPENLASAGKRFLNYLIDVIIFYIGAFALGMIAALMNPGFTGEGVGIMLLMYGFFFLYYVIMEAAFGKTVGKMITRTRVVDMHGEKPSFGEAFIRTISRIVPFEFISVWIGEGVMWHDSWASTRVIND